TATATDGDGDHAAASLDLTPQLVFKDDGPAIDPVSSVVNFANGATTGPKALNEVAGADGFSSHQITSFPSPLILADGTTSLPTKLDNNNTVLTYFNDTSNPGVIDPGEAFFKLPLNNNNTYPFDVLHDLPPITVPLNFAAIASGGPKETLAVPAGNTGVNIVFDGLIFANGTPDFGGSTTESQLSAFNLGASSPDDDLTTNNLGFCVKK